jgi:hypothetical protein
MLCQLISSNLNADKLLKYKLLTLYEVQPSTALNVKLKSLNKDLTHTLGLNKEAKLHL